MIRKNKKILTRNQEIYTKFNSLNFLNEIVLCTVSKCQLTKILNNINKDKIILTKEEIGDYVLIRKKSPIDFSVYLQNNK